jgi:L-alanine-DL-glutamate epimerase-like enolase superfamily enzyme
MTPETTLRMLRLLPSGLDLVLEAPCRTWLETMSLRRRTDVPILLDELVNDTASAIQAIADDAADAIGLKVSSVGGLTPGRRVRDLCVAGGLTVSLQDTTGSDLAFAAVVHLAQTVPPRYLRCILEAREIVTKTTVENPIPLVDGHATAPIATYA